MKPQPTTVEITILLRDLESSAVRGGYGVEVGPVARSGICESMTMLAHFPDRQAAANFRSQVAHLVAGLKLGHDIPDAVNRISKSPFGQILNKMLGR